MGEYDRFSLAGGLDSSTPYIARTPGTLLQSRNFSPDTDGGYRLRGGFERYDGRLSPSSVSVTNLHMTDVVTGILCGDTVTGATSGAVGVVGKVTGREIWVDVQSGEFQSGELVAGFTLDFITFEPVATSSYVPNTVDEPSIIIVTPQPGFNPVVGGKIRGDLTGATALVTAVLVSAVDMWIYVMPLEGTISSNEPVRDQEGGYADTSSSQSVENMIANPDTPAGVWFYLSELRRAKIQPVPGDGDVMGVWELADSVYAFRDQKMFKSTPNGWSEVDLGFLMTWTDRASTVVDNDLGTGDILRGATSGATGKVGFVGYSTQDHKDGYFSVTDITGTFQLGEDLVNTSAADEVIGKVGQLPVANELPDLSLGMRFVNHNFFATVDTMAMYATTGTGPAFAYNPNIGFCPILTGRDVEDPYDVIVHKDHLFLAYPKASLQHSVVGNPFDWSGSIGALEVGVGSDVTSLVSSPKSLIICTEKDVQSLSGEGIDSWVKDIVTSHNGIARYSGQYQSQTFVLSRNGIVAIDRTDQFGNFSDSATSDRIRNLLRPRYDKCVCAVARKDKGVYAVYYNDGTCIGMATYQGQLIGFYTFDHGGQIVRNAVAPYSRVWFYTASGFIYQDDVGYSCDGAPKVASFRTSYANQGDPDTRKRFRRCDITFNAEAYVNVFVNFSFDKGAGEAQSTIDYGLISSNGGRWDSSNWNQVFWDASEFPTIATDISGVGFDISTMVYISSRIHPEFVVEDISFEWSTRRKVR